MFRISEELISKKYRHDTTYFTIDEMTLELSFALSGVSNALYEARSQKAVLRKNMFATDHLRSIVNPPDLYMRRSP